MTKRNRIYPVFLPHAGCPFRCVYCNQHLVTRSHATGRTSRNSLTSLFGGKLREQAEHARRTSSPGEVAFYGGTFTCLSRDTMTFLLDAGAEWVRKGVFTGIRFSTRPDGIAAEICSFLSQYPICTVELGVQSLSEHVLAKSRRGYSVQAVEQASNRVRANGWTLGIQLMVGLPGDTRESFSASISRGIDLCPDFVRIYPTLVLEGTTLADWYRGGLYKPLSLKDAISWCVGAYGSLLQKEIRLARAGLHADPELEKPGSVVAGPYHPAFGYLVRVHWWREQVDWELHRLEEGVSGRSLIVLVPRQLISEAIGPRRINVRYWKRRWSLGDVVVRGRTDWAEPRVVCQLE